MEPTGTGTGTHPDSELERREGGDRDAVDDLVDVADAAASLGAVDYEAVGLGDFGRPDGFLERQVPRWRAELDSYGELEGYPGPEIPGLEDVGAWLEESRPASWRPGIMHGDYHLANVLFAPDEPAQAKRPWRRASCSIPSRSGSSSGR